MPSGSGGGGGVGLTLACGSCSNNCESDDSSSYSSSHRRHSSSSTGCMSSNGRRNTSCFGYGGARISNSGHWKKQLTWTILTLVVIFAQFVQVADSIQWLAVGGWERRYWNKTSDCSRKRTSNCFVKTQRQICRRNMELMPVVTHATQQTVMVCQDIFRNRRWNCTSIVNAPNYNADLIGGSREQAIVYALSSAALTQSISKACAMGITTKCGCGPIPNEAPPGDFKWGGCGADLGFGSIFTRMFADAPYMKSRFSKIGAVNRHNNQVGRMIVQQSLSTACKCHGVSGSCAIKTCWKGLPDLPVIGTALQQKYGVAVEVKTKNKKGSDNKREKILVPVYGNRKKVNNDELIYITKSPDYCLPDPSLGSIGTYGRECRKEDSGSGGCQSMCCGRGYTTQTVRVKYRCDCKYYWCCYVKCKTCTKTVEVHRCR